MPIILYNLIISPLEYIIEILFTIFFQILELDLISSIFFISLAVSLFCLPLYCRADNIRKEEDEKFSRIKPYVDKIKKNFKGDEKFFLLQTLYRQNNYNPIMVLRNSFSLLLQIPFFIAAYHFFSHLGLLNNYSWGIFKDFSQPDSLLYLGGIHINILPIIMTVINIVSCEIYLKEKSFKTRLQPYSFALIFLILLYNSPSALVIYWTFNNFFYLLKNKFMDNNPKAFAYILLVLAVLVSFFGNWRWFVDTENLHYNLLKIIGPFLLVFLSFKYWKQINRVLTLQKENFGYLLNLLFIISALGIILLQAVIIPIGLFNSDLSSYAIQFDNLKVISNILVENLFSFIGLFLFWGGVVFYFTKSEYRIYYVIAFLTIYFNNTFNYLNLGKELGSISPDLIFDINDTVQRCFGSLSVRIPNLLVLLFIIIITLYIFRKKLVKQAMFIVLVAFASELIVSGIYIYRLANGISNINKIKTDKNLIEAFSKKIELSATEKNVIIIFLDRFAAGFLPMLFEEKPELKNKFSGFVFYPNTVSFYGSTVLGYPPMIAGYEYTPFKIDKDKRKFPEKWLEANLMLLTLFKNSGYTSTVVEPMVYFDFFGALSHQLEDSFGSIYNSRDIKFIKMAGRYSAKLRLDSQDNLKAVKLLKKRFYLYSFFCVAPKLFKSFIYDNGNYLFAWSKENKNNSFEERTTIEAYSSLLYMKDITKVSSNKNTFTLINNDLPHNMFFLQYPQYEYVKEVTDIGPNKYKFIDNNSFKSYHTAMAAAIITGQYLDYLRQLNVYDNSRIIIVSDHGNAYSKLPQYTDFQNINITPFNPLLMVKDFNQNFELKTDNTFMTNADTPCLATKDLLNEPRNPFTGKLLSMDEKQNGANIYMNIFYVNPSAYTSHRVIIDKYPIIKHVKDNIFDESNWKFVKYKYTD